MGSGEIMRKRDYVERMEWIQDDIQAVMDEMMRIGSDLDVLIELADRTTLAEGLRAIAVCVLQARDKMDYSAVGLDREIEQHKQAGTGG